jgi:hypothetical protein
MNPEANRQPFAGRFSQTEASLVFGPSTNNWQCWSIDESHSPSARNRARVALVALDVAQVDRRTIAHPYLEPATPTVAGSDARGRRPRALPPVSRRQHTGH